MAALQRKEGGAMAKTVTAVLGSWKSGYWRWGEKVWQSRWYAVGGGQNPLRQKDVSFGGGGGQPASSAYLGKVNWSMRVRDEKSQNHLNQLSAS